MIPLRFIDGYCRVCGIWRSLPVDDDYDEESNVGVCGKHKGVAKRLR